MFFGGRAAASPRRAGVTPRHAGEAAARRFQQGNEEHGTRESHWEFMMAYVPESTLSKMFQGQWKL